MAYPKLKELELNKKTTTVVLLQAIEESETKSGRPYCKLTLSDGDTTVTANIWDTAKEGFKIPEKSLMTAEVYPKMYQESVSYEVYRYGAAPEDAKLEDYIIHAPYKSEDMYNSILGNVRKAGGDSPLVALVESIYEENREKLMYWSAAKSVHHNFSGGLLYHTFRMVRSGMTLSQVYPSLKKDVLLAGIALHDIGKLEELATDNLGVAEYTVDGSLFTHAYIGMRMIEETGKKLGTPEDLVRQVMHVIAAHHGQLDWGAIAVPATPEAMVCHHIDMIDSRMEQFEKAYEDMEPGTMSKRLFGLGTSVYKPI